MTLAQAILRVVAVYIPTVLLTGYSAIATYWDVKGNTGQSALGRWPFWTESNELTIISGFAGVVAGLVHRIETLVRKQVEDNFEVVAVMVYGLFVLTIIPIFVYPGYKAWNGSPDRLFQYYYLISGIVQILFYYWMLREFSSRSIGWGTTIAVIIGIGILLTGWKYVVPFLEA